MRPRKKSADGFVCACATARHVARLLTQMYDESLRDVGIQAPQFALLMTIDTLGPASQAALGRRHALDKTTISRNLRLLERKGWIETAPGADRRQRRFTLTPGGRRRLAAAKPAWQKAQERLRAAMSEQEWDAMFRAFRAVAQAARGTASID